MARGLLSARRRDSAAGPGRPRIALTEAIMPERALAHRIMDEVDRSFDEQTRVLADLVRFPSRRGEEARAQDFMSRLYREHDLAVDRWKIEIDDIKHLRGFSPVSISYEDAW